jgi:hypothetical protein
MSIINEVYVVANISLQQYRVSFKVVLRFVGLNVVHFFLKNYYKDKTDNKKMTDGTQAATSSAASSSDTTAPSTSININSPVDNLTEPQKIMIQQFATQSNLNLMWAHEY